MANNTWSGLTLEQDQIWKQLWDEYVPPSGMASTVGGEIIRAMSRIIYRFYNDGDMVGVGYGNETCNSSDRYLCDIVPDYVTLDQFYECQEKEYENQMLKNHRLVFFYLMNNKEVFEQQNTTDSREVSDEDLRRERQSHDDYDEPECDYDWEDDDFFEGEEEDDGERYSLVGVDGNAFAIMGYVVRAMRETGFTQDEIEAYREDAVSDDYNHLLCVSADIIDKCNERC